MKHKLAITLSLLLVAGISQGAAAESGQSLDVNQFRRDLDRHHELFAKGDPKIRRDIKLLERLVMKAPDFPGLWASLAAAEGKTGNDAAAEADFQKALSRASGWEGAAALKSDYLKTRGKRDDAEILIRSAMTIDPGHPVLERRLASIVFQDKPLKSAALWDAYRTKHPMSGDALLASARAEFAAGRVAESRTKMKQAQVIYPMSREVLEWLERASLDERESSSLRKYIASKGLDCDDLNRWVEGLAQGKDADALALYTQACTRYPDCPSLWRHLGQTQESAGSKPEALASYRTACALLGGSDPFISSRIKELGGTTECAAGAAQDKWVSLWKGNARKTLDDIKVRAFFGEKDFPLSLLLRVARDKTVGEDLRAFLKPLQKRLPVPCGLVEAASWRAAGKTDKAIETLKTTADTRPLDTRPYSPWIDACRAKSDTAAALAVCDRWETLDVGTGPLYHRAVLFSDGKEWKRVLPLLEEVLSREPAHFDAWRMKVATLDALGMKAESNAAIEDWAAWKPLDRRAYETWIRRVKPGSDLETQITIVLKNLRQPPPEK